MVARQEKPASTGNVRTASAMACTSPEYVQVICPTSPGGACAPRTGGGWRRTRVWRERRWPNFIIWRWAGRALGGWIPCLRRAPRQPLRRPVHSISENPHPASQRPPHPAGKLPRGREPGGQKKQPENPRGRREDRPDAQPVRLPGKVGRRRGRVAGRPRVRRARVAVPRVRRARVPERAARLPGKLEGRPSARRARALGRAGGRPGAPSIERRGSPLSPAPRGWPAQRHS